VKRRSDKFLFFCSYLPKHMHFYSSWVEQARLAGLDMSLLVMVSLRSYRHALEQVKHMKVPVVIIPRFPIIRSALIYFYLMAQCILYSSVTAHVMNLYLDRAKWFKRLFPRFRFMIYLEGDIEAELEYLLDHPYKSGFYDDSIFKAKKAIVNIKRRIAFADSILACTHYAKHVYIKRYSLPDDRVYVLPFGADSSAIYYNEHIRRESRHMLNLEDDRFVIVFIGSVYYSWQNLSKTIAMVKLLSKHMLNTYLMLIIRESDHPIVTDLIAKHQLDPSVYMLAKAQQGKQNMYLNAADAGVLLRASHPMNYSATPAKIGEYSIAGLPLIITEAACTYHDEVTSKGFGIVFRDVDEYTTINQRIHVITENKPDREEISQWGFNRFATESYRDEYKRILLAVSSSHERLIP